MNAKELKDLANEYADVADDKAEIAKIAERIRKTHASDSAANALGQRCKDAVDGDTVRQICSEVK